MSQAAVKNGKLMHVSPSQLTTHSSCARKWWLQKIAKIPEPPNPEGAAAFGSDVHNAVEDFYHEGTQPDVTTVIGRYAKKVLEYFPKPGPTIESETSIQGYVQAASVPFHGFIDLLDHSDGDKVSIWDLKTRSSFQRNYDEDGLARDIQLSVYARYAHKRFGANPVIFNHLYVQTEPKRHEQPDFEPKVVPVSVEVSPEQIEETFEEVITPAVEAIKFTASITNEQDVPKNLAACDMFGPKYPCPYKQRCFGSKPLGKLLSGFPESTTSTALPMSMSLADKLKSGTTAPTTQATSSTVEGLVLYVDTYPLKSSGGITRLEDYIAPIAKEIADRAGVMDVREMKFGEGTTALIAAIKRNPPTGKVAATSMGLSGLVVEALSAQATDVIKPLR